jgi:hypothetical protein
MHQAMDPRQNPKMTIEKTGTEKLEIASAMTSWSIHEPAFQAARTAAGTATPTAKSMVRTMTDNVGSIRCMISLATGKFVKMDVSRSPWRILQNDSASWTTNG